jgi:hypothetical protein
MIGRIGEFIGSKDHQFDATEKRVVMRLGGM